MVYNTHLSCFMNRHLDNRVFVMLQTKETWTTHTQSWSIMCSLLLWANYVPTGFWCNYIKAIINLFLQRTHCIMFGIQYSISQTQDSCSLCDLHFFFPCSSDSAKVLTVSSAGSDFKVKVHERCCIKSIQNNRTIAPKFHLLFHVSVCLSVSNSWIKRCMCENKKTWYYSASPNLTPMHKGYIY